MKKSSRLILMIGGMLALLLLTSQVSAKGNSPHFWSVFSGTWQTVNGQLSTNCMGCESWIWAGIDPIVICGDFDASVTIAFPNPPQYEPGRHGGFMFYASVPTQRTDYSMTGYEIDWIDRYYDHGIRLIRWDHGNSTALVESTPNLENPPLVWELQVQGPVIRFFGDGQLLFEVTDSTYRSGHFGLWSHQQEMYFDDVQVGRHFTDDFSRSSL